MHSETSLHSERTTTRKISLWVFCVTGRGPHKHAALCLTLGRGSDADVVDNSVTHICSQMLKNVPSDKMDDPTTKPISVNTQFCTA